MRKFLALPVALLMVLGGHQAAGADDQDDWISYQVRPQSNVSSLAQHRAIGTLYTTRYDGSVWQCTATLIQPDIIMTAAHCLHPGGSQWGFWDQFEFCPARIGSTNPFGCWNNWTEATVTAEWGNSGNYGGDVGFVRFNANGSGQLPGNSVSSWLSAYFNPPRDELWTAIGYPLGAWGGNNQMVLHAEQFGTVSGSPDDRTKTGGDWCQTGGGSGSPLIRKWTESYVGSGYNRPTHVLSTYVSNHCRWAYLGNQANSAFWAVF